MESGDGGLGYFIPSKRSGLRTSVDCVNKENGEKVAVNFFTFIPYLFFFSIFKESTLQDLQHSEQQSVEKEVGVAERLDNLGRITLQWWKEKLDL